jgi:hypothetical protein
MHEAKPWPAFSCANIDDIMVPTTAKFTPWKKPTCLASHSHIWRTIRCNTVRGPVDGGHRLAAAANPTHEE